MESIRGVKTNADEWAVKQKAPENRAFGLVTERKRDLCDECSYYRPLRYKSEEKLYLCELCYKG